MHEIRIAGTPIEVAMDDGRPRTILVSDLHIPHDGGAVLTLFQELLRDAAAGPACRLVVLGDLFDAFVGPKQARVGVWREVAAAVACAGQAGVSVTLLHGNRDFMLDGTFASLAECRVVAGGLCIDLGGRRCVLLHGDELCQRDRPYQRAKRLLRHPATKVMLRNVPLAVTLRLAARARARSLNVIASGDQSRFDPVAPAVAEAFAAGAELLVFGHIHRPARGRFDAGGGQGEYAILPAFDQEGVHLQWLEGCLAYRTVAGGALPDYPPREFC